MKKITTIITIMIIASILFFTGCAKDGDDGLAYIDYNDFTFTTSIVSFVTDDPGFTEAAWDSWDYNEIDPGTYSYTCTLHDSWGDTTYVLTGSYEITVNKGKAGSGLTDGEDGTDRYYDLYLEDDSVYVENSW